MCVSVSLETLPTPQMALPSRLYVGHTQSLPTRESELGLQAHRGVLTHAPAPSTTLSMAPGLVPWGGRLKREPCSLSVPARLVPSEGCSWPLSQLLGGAGDPWGPLVCSTSLQFLPLSSHGITPVSTFLPFARAPVTLGRGPLCFTVISSHQ